MTQSDAKFSGPVPEMYDRFMVPMLFQPFAEDMASRVAALKPLSVLETAAGSGVVTRVLAPMLSEHARYVVTDLNAPMLEQAQRRQVPDPRIEWAVADALELDFADATFDVVCCQFGAMFFPDKVKGYAQAKRVLKTGAPFIFNVWDSLSQNEVSGTVWQAVTAHYPEDPPTFLVRLPHGYCDKDRIRTELTDAGFGRISIETVTRESRAQSARDAAMALVQGTPLRMELTARDPDGLASVTDEAEAALRERYGDGPIVGRTQALMVVATT